MYSATVCRYCRNDIIDGAIYCAKCNHYQSTKNNILRYLGGAGPLAIIVASVSYLISVSMTEHPAIDPVIIALRSDDAIVIQNRSDHDYFVASLSYKIPLEGRPEALYTKQIGRIIPAKKIERHDFLPKYDGPWRFELINEKAADKELATLVAAAHDDGDCVEIVFAAPDDSGLKLIKDQMALNTGSRLASKRAEGYIEFF